MRIRVEVTKKHIRLGKIGTSTQCPVALALFAVKIPFRVAVDVGTLDRFNNIPCPKKVASFVCAFDAGEPVKPFFFTLRLPKEFNV